jgi:hypothetical protein
MDRNPNQTCRQLDAQGLRHACGMKQKAKISPGQASNPLHIRTSMCNHAKVA